MPAARERGQSTTVWFALVVVALFAVVGLVVDGGAKSVANRRAETAAQAAARAGADAAATGALSGSPDGYAAQAAAQAWLEAAGVPGTVAVSDGRVRVSTQVDVQTTFLSVIGIAHLTGAGSAEAELRRG